MLYLQKQKTPPKSSAIFSTSVGLTDENSTTSTCCLFQILMNVPLVRTTVISTLRALTQWEVTRVPVTTALPEMAPHAQVRNHVWYDTGELPIWKWPKRCIRTAFQDKFIVTFLGSPHETFQNVLIFPRNDSQD